MRNAERYALGAIVNGLRKSGTIDNRTLDIIADELLVAAHHAANYGTVEPPVIELLATDVREMRF